MSDLDKLVSLLSPPPEPPPEREVETTTRSATRLDTDWYRRTAKSHLEHNLDSLREWCAENLGYDESQFAHLVSCIADTDKLLPDDFVAASDFESDTYLTGAIKNLDELWRSQE